MTREEFLNAVDKLYNAIRKTYGYNENADKLIDQLEDMADAWEEKEQA